MTRRPRWLSGAAIVGLIAVMCGPAGAVPFNLEWRAENNWFSIRKDGWSPCDTAGGAVMETPLSDEWFGASGFYITPLSAKFFATNGAILSTTVSANRDQERSYCTSYLNQPA